MYIEIIVDMFTCVDFFSPPPRSGGGFPRRFRLHRVVNNTFNNLNLRISLETKKNDYMFH